MPDDREPTDATKPRKGQLYDHWALMVLLAVRCVRGGAVTSGLVAGLRLIPQQAIAEALEKLEHNELIFHKDGRWFPSPDLDVQFKI